MIGIMIRTIILALTLNLAVAAGGAWAGPPSDTIRGVVDKIVEIIKNPAYQGPAHQKQRLKLIKQAVDPRFDYREMAKRCLGATWRTISAAEQNNFVELFAELLEASYADKIDKYGANVKFDYLGEQLDGEYAEVRTLAVRPNDRVPLNYRLIQTSGGWMVYDVVIEGVSLVSNYRSQFSRVISESSYTELVRRLRTKVEELRRTG